VSLGKLRCMSRFNIQEPKVDREFEVRVAAASRRHHFARKSK